MLELATLGLLQQEPLHGYRLKQQLELFMSSCISVNYGAIYPLLRRLEKRGLICVLMEGDSNSGTTSKTIYSISEAGKKRWYEKMLEHPHESWVNSRSRFMIKFFFFSHLSPAERIKLIEQRINVCRLRSDNRNLDCFPEDSYQKSACGRYEEVVQSEVDWLQEQLTEEKQVSPL